MKKVSLITSAVVALATTAMADTIGGEIAIGGWHHDPSGWVQYPANTTDANKIDLDDDLKLDTKSEIYVRAKLEHPIPVLPNIKLAYTQVRSHGDTVSTRGFKFGDIDFPANAAITTDAQLDSYDATFYYELIDIGFDFDLGLTVRYVDGFTDLSATGGVLTSPLHQRNDISTFIPMLYTNIRVPVPFIDDFSIGLEGNYVTYDGSTVYDLQADLRYTVFMGLGIEAGYRAQKYKLNDVDNTSSDIDIQGLFIGAVWDF